MSILNFFLNKSVDNLTGNSWQQKFIKSLDNPQWKRNIRGNLRSNAYEIEKIFTEHEVNGLVKEVNAGPLYTQYCVEINSDIDINTLHKIRERLTRVLSTKKEILIEAPISGRNLIGFNIPNDELDPVSIRRMLQSDIFRKSTNPLNVVLGLDLTGSPVIYNIANDPYIVISGTTGSGKSMLLHSWILSLLFKTTPEQVKFLFVDLKGREFTSYNKIPHILSPVISNHEDLVQALQAVVQEIDKRNKLMLQVGVNHIEKYNKLNDTKPLPYILIFIDDLIIPSSEDKGMIKKLISSITLKGKHNGIFLIISGQKYTVEFMRDIMKINMPTRICFSMTNIADSIELLDSEDAFRLEGSGDMYFLPSNSPSKTRIQGAFVSEIDINSISKLFKD